MGLVAYCLPGACCLYDDLSVRYTDVAGKWQTYPDLSWMRGHSLGAICDFFAGLDLDVIAVADGIRVVNSDYLFRGCQDRGLSVRTFAKVRAAAAEWGVLDRDFYSVGFGPGLFWRYS